MASHYIRKSTTVLDSGFHATDSGFEVLDPPFLVSEIWILIPLFSVIPVF